MPMIGMPLPAMTAGTLMYPRNKIEAKDEGFLALPTTSTPLQNPLLQQELY